MQPVKIVRVDRTLLDEARAAFRARSIVADMSRDQIMIDEGARRVLDWLEAKINKPETDTVGAPADEVEFTDRVEYRLRKALKA